MNLPPYNKSVRTGSISSSTEDDEDVAVQGIKRKASYSTDQDNNDEKRKNFLERNRQGKISNVIYVFNKFSKQNKNIIYRMK